MTDQFKNFAYSTVVTAPSPATSGTSLVVASGQGGLFPTAPFNITIWPIGQVARSSNAEIVTVTAKSGDTFTIVRAQESTNARTVIVGDQVALTVSKDLLESIEVGYPIESFGRYVDANTLYDDAFAAAAASGRLIRLKAGRTYYLSTTVTPVSGSRFCCLSGIATIKLKTGSGGFNLLNYGVSGAVVFDFDEVDDIAVENVRFVSDVAAEVCLRPIRCIGGLDEIGARFRNLQFQNIAIGVMVDIASAGVGGYLVENVCALDCGATQGSGYWTGPIQWTLVQLDDDMLGSPTVYSERGVINNLAVVNCLFSGDALTDFGQQTDCFTHAGAGSTKPGPRIHGIYADGIGEVVDCFGMGTIITGIQIESCTYYGVKFIHSAQFNYAELDYIGAWGISAVTFQGSSGFTQHTQYNTVKISTATGGGTIAVAGFEPSVVSLGDNGGDASHCLPKNNQCVIANAIGNGSDLDYIVRDGCADNDNANFVEIAKAAGWAIALSTGNPDNVRIRCFDATDVKLGIPSNQSLTTTVPAVVDFSTVMRDRKGEAVTGSDKVRCAFPGRKHVYAQVRVTGVSAGDTIELEILRNGGNITTAQHVVDADGRTYSIHDIVYIDEDWPDTASADLQIRITVTSGGTILVTSNNTLTYFQVTDLA